MESLIIHILCWSFILLFGAMSLTPLMLEGRKSKAPRTSGLLEDRVVRFDDRSMIEHRQSALPAPNQPEERPAA